jgi:hypothetical protein
MTRMTQMPLRVSVPLAIALVAAACASSGSQAPEAAPVRGVVPLLTWMGEETRPAGTVYPTLADSARYGSLSGLVRDPLSPQWVAVIDDRDGTRVAWITIELGDSGLRVTPTRLTMLSAGPGVPVEVATQGDLEAITALPDGSFLMSEEGHRTPDGGVWQPAILHVARDGTVTDVVSYPPAFRLQAGARGVRDNQGFESLTRTPRGRLIAGLEQPLVEDGEPSSFERGARGRLIEFEPRGNGWRPGRQWIYPIDKTPRVEGFDEICDDGENGLADLLALSETTLIAIERACLRDRARNRTTNPIRLFVVELGRYQRVRKSLLLDLTTLTNRLSSALARLDNFEALAFGPPSAFGPSLLVVSDDNFRASQSTAFLLFGLRTIQ